MKNLNKKNPNNSNESKGGSYNYSNENKNKIAIINSKVCIFLEYADLAKKDTLNGVVNYPFLFPIPNDLLLDKYFYKNKE